MLRRFTTWMTQKRKMTRIGTHSGSFHCDESLAVHMLKQTQQYQDAEIVRSRDPKVWETCDILVDVGAEFNVEKQRFDHHQRGFAETFDARHATKLSSAGLVYKYFGREVVAKVAGTSDEAVVDLLYQKVYDNFIEELDAVDNGISRFGDAQAIFHSAGTSLSARVGKLNSNWNEVGVDADERFLQASALAGKEFTQKIENYVHSWLPARSIVQDALAKANEVDSTGRIVVLPQFCPWKAHLADLERETGIEGQPIYVLYADQSGKWRVQAVAERMDSFASRLKLPAEWCGVRGEELSKLSGIDGCVFVHANGFIGGTETYDGALAMAKQALEIGDAQKR